MALDIQAEAYLKVVEEIRNETPVGLDPQPSQLRAWSQLIKSKAQVSLDPVQRSQDQLISGPLGSLAVRLYHPFDEAPSGAVVFFHGGGFVTGSVDLRDNLCRSISNRSRWRVVSVEYALSPEDKYPAALNDGQAAFEWAREHLGNKIVVMGDSAGATIASVLAIRNRSQIAAQVLIYPWLDLEMTSSSIEKYNGIILSRASLNWFVNQYLPAGVSAHDPSVSPYFETNLKDLPAAFVLTAEYDPLRDEGQNYADRLQHSGNRVQHRCYPGMVHGFIDCNKFIDQSQNAIDDICEYLKAL